MKENRLLTFGITCLTIAFLTGCGGVKHSDLLMLDQVQNQLLDIDTIPPLVIRTDDILNIQVASRNPETVTAFQIRGDARASAGERALGVQEGYRVDEEGVIYLPFLGKVQAAGRTIIEFREDITEQLVKFIPDASVQVRFLNFRVTLLGEVVRPNTYVIPNERLTILEAIGMAGDFTAYARRDAVLVIRERSNERTFARVNTQDITVFESECFYLKPNDIVYVEPLKGKQYATEGDFINRYWRLLVPVISFGTFMLGVMLTQAPK